MAGTIVSVQSQKCIRPRAVIHEALMHETSADVSVPTASKILQSGYKFKDRVIRPARVAVTDPIG